MLALIDADLVAYRSAASCEPNKQKAEREPLEVAITRANDTMHRILESTGATEYRAFLTGSENFRYNLDPEYKANRKGMKRPEWLQPVREFLVVTWGAEVSDGIEADDAIGIAATSLANKGD